MTVVSVIPHRKEPMADCTLSSRRTLHFGLATLRSSPRSTADRLIPLRFLLTLLALTTRHMTCAALLVSCGSLLRMVPFERDRMDSLLAQWLSVSCVLLVEQASLALHSFRISVLRALFLPLAATKSRLAFASRMRRCLLSFRVFRRASLTAKLKSDNLALNFNATLLTLVSV